MLWWLPGVLVGCIEFGLDPIDDPDPPPELVVVQESFVQRPLPSLDVLVVVDASPSMTQELEALGSGVTGLVEVLDAQDVSWQLGVVAAVGGLALPGDVLLRGDPWVLTSEVPDVEATFAAALPKVSITAGEGGLAAAVFALDGADGGLNAGFRRHGAALLVVFVSDGDDTSDALLGGDAVSAFLDTLTLEADRYGAPTSASAVVGPLPDGCTSASGSARPAPRYHEVVEASGGVAESVCNFAFDAILESVAQDAVVYPSAFPLSGIPETPDVRVRVDGSSVSDWTVEVADGTATLQFGEPPAAAARIDVSYVVSNTQRGTTSASTTSGPASSMPEGAQ